MSRKRSRGGAEETTERAVCALLSRLPHYAQYSQAKQSALDPEDPIYAHLEKWGLWMA